MCLFINKNNISKITSSISFKSKHIIPLELLLRQLAIIGSFTCCVILATALYSQQWVLAVFTFLFLIVCIGSFFLAKYQHINLAIHLLLDGFVIGFTITPFCGIYYLSGILIYPLIVALAIFFLHDPLKRFFYAIVCAISCVLFIYQIGVSNYESVPAQLLVESLITFGLLSALFIVGYNYFTVLFNYQSKIVESKNLLKIKNVELNNYIDSNLQLENFAHLASHELKTPLRNILNFSKLLSAKVGDNVSVQEKEMLGIIENQAFEMDELIKDLFELSSVTNEPLKADKLELEEIIHNLIKFDFFEYKSNIKVNHIPKQITGNRSHIKEVFKNLIANGLKFVSAEKKAEIVIDCIESPKEFQFSVKDNGIGISKTNREKVFLIFKRLHTRKDFEGTGIGLAICKKIVERHLGKIWIEDNPSGGTIFNFTIAKNLA